MNFLMKSHSINKRGIKIMKKNRIYLFVLFIVFSAFTHLNVYSQDIPGKPNPPRLVNDFAGLLSGTEVNLLERKLVSFTDSTSTQIAIVIVKDLNGYAPADYAQRLGEKWGIGQKGLNNGILILVKPKSETRGEVQIATGYGAEGPVPDLACQDIVNNEILPAFRKGDYYSGLNDAVVTLTSLIRGEFTASEYGQRASKSSGKGIPFAFIIFFIFIIISLISKKSGGPNSKNISTGGLPFWLLMGMMGSGRGSHSGSWGGFSGGGSSGGGFGGFGGGSFGGGGAGGSW
jgi:uncharacterized protein